MVVSLIARLRYLGGVSVEICFFLDHKTCYLNKVMSQVIRLM